ncbi:hypothetical protein YC2023_107267 [Brassica napus]
MLVSKHRETDWIFSTDSSHLQLLMKLPEISHLILISDAPKNVSDSPPPPEDNDSERLSRDWSLSFFIERGLLFTRGNLHKLLKPKMFVGLSVEVVCRELKAIMNHSLKAIGRLSNSYLEAYRPTRLSRA